MKFFVVRASLGRKAVLVSMQSIIKTIKLNKCIGKTDIKVTINLNLDEV